jgi:hypothetical protein
MKIFIIFFCFFTVSFAAMAQEKKLTWDYPVKPGTEEWEKCKSQQDIYDACQIPDDILKKLDTETLLQICLEYPAPTVFFIFSTPQEGFDGFYSQFNGIRELMNRKDAGICLLKKYSMMSLKGLDILLSLEIQGQFVSKFYYIELFLVQPIILKSFSRKERIDLLKESSKKLEMKLAHDDLFGGINLGATVWIMARTLHLENIYVPSVSESQNLVNSLETGRLIDLNIEAIYQHVKIYTNEQ